MKKKDLEQLGLTGHQVLKEAIKVTSKSRSFGVRKKQLKEDLACIAQTPENFLHHELYGLLANEILHERQFLLSPRYVFEPKPFEHWGDDIDSQTFSQMEDACALPITAAAALMPDAHLGYGLPIGGVLATRGAVIPYAVGVDIACRVMMTVFDLPIDDLRRKRALYEDILEKKTQFGIGAKWKNKKSHSVMDLDWNVSPRTATLKDIAWGQLGTSGSGNHFVEFGTVKFLNQFGEIPEGEYIAVVSHSGSRGAGARVAQYYTDLAQKLHPTLPKRYRHLSWLPLDGEGQEYWQAMELMGAYASANHHVIHREIRKACGGSVLFEIENHHNFAWKESHGGEEVVVHRKGATPAHRGTLGYIPGTMVAPGFLVEGLGNETSLCSSSHGAGRQMSRKKAKSTTTLHALKQIVREHGVSLLSAGLDESPHAYKDILRVMTAQSDLVRILARFDPKIVKMAPDGELAED
ncbi:MAG: RtcB family protein [Bdellovibrionales bacterium]|nr:RtcB family protein [Bdellovibrionales bacterium]